MQELFFGKEKVSLLERCPRFRGVLRGGLVLYVASLAQEAVQVLWDCTKPRPREVPLEAHRTHTAVELMYVHSQHKWTPGLFPCAVSVISLSPGWNISPAGAVL